MAISLERVFPKEESSHLRGTGVNTPHFCQSISPPEVPFQTKPELALALIDQARAWGVPFAWVVADAGYGDNPTFLQGLEARQIAYMVGVSSSFGVRLPDDVHAAALVPPPRPRG